VNTWSFKQHVQSKYPLIATTLRYGAFVKKEPGAMKDWQGVTKEQQQQQWSHGRMLMIEKSCCL